MRKDIPPMLLREQLISEAREQAKNSHIAVVVVGLPDSYESEGFNRSNMNDMLKAVQ